LIRGDGLAAGTTLTAEVVFHLEGEVAVINDTAGNSTVLVDDSAQRAIGSSVDTERVDMLVQLAHPIALGVKQCGRAVVAAAQQYLSSGRAGKHAAGAAKVLGLLM